MEGIINCFLKYRNFKLTCLCGKPKIMKQMVFWKQIHHIYLGFYEYMVLLSQQCKNK